MISTTRHGSVGPACRYSVDPRQGQGEDNKRNHARQCPERAFADRSHAQKAKQPAISPSAASAYQSKEFIAPIP
jgi:hypothetical protein